MKKTFYYSDELNDDFLSVKREPIQIGEDFKYINSNFFWKILEFIAYWIIMLPVAFLYTKIKFGLKIKNKKVMKGYRKKGCFMYGNHTQAPADGFIQALVSFPSKSRVIVAPENLSLKGTKNFMLMMGAMPLPSSIKGYKNFLTALNHFIKKNKSIVIYPEAHIWPYYTKIRNFKSVSFNYPVKNNKPSFSFTTVYKKRKLRKIPKIIVYIDGPFFPNTSLDYKEAERELRNDIYNAMTNRAMQSDCEYYQYIKEE